MYQNDYFLVVNTMVTLYKLFYHLSHIFVNSYMECIAFCPYGETTTWDTITSDATIVVQMAQNVSF